MSNLEGENYQVSHSEEENKVSISGTLRLRGIEEYGDITVLLEQLLHTKKDAVVDLTKLEFLNSSGIAMLSRFVINARKAENAKLTILSSADVPWQGKSLKNLQRLMPSLELTIR